MVRVSVNIRGRVGVTCRVGLESRAKVMGPRSGSWDWGRLGIGIGIRCGHGVGKGEGQEYKSIRNRDGSRSKSQVSSVR